MLSKNYRKNRRAPSKLENGLVAPLGWPLKNELITLNFNLKYWVNTFFYGFMELNVAWLDKRSNQVEKIQ